MYNIRKRIDKVEKQLFPPEEWLTYEDQLKNKPINGHRFIYLDPDEELKARAVQKEAVIG